MARKKQPKKKKRIETPVSARAEARRKRKPTGGERPKTKLVVKKTEKKKRPTTRKVTPQRKTKPTGGKRPKKKFVGRKTEPSKGMSKAEKSRIAKRARSGRNVKGGEFKKVAAATAKTYGSKEAGERVAAAAMWKEAAKKGVTKKGTIKKKKVKRR